MRDVAPRESFEEILIVGAGPAGLFTAAELARHGVAARLIEKNCEPHRQTRATSIQPSSLEVLRRAGMLEAVLDAAHRVYGMQIVDRAFVPVLATSLEDLDTPYSFVASLPQWKTEALLETHLRQLDGMVERDVCAETIEACDGGSRVVVRQADGERVTIWARYLVGAGGAHGPVRGAMHEHLDGTTYPFAYLVGDIAADFPFDRRRMAIVLSGLGLVMLIPIPEERWLVFLDLPDASVPGPAPAAAELCGALELHLGTAPTLRDLRWCGLFHTHRRIAPRFGDGRRFLVGDNAHICSPFGGEGLNAGLQDGADLAWKLALVTKGLGRPMLLDAYDTERLCAANQVLASTDAVHKRFYALIEMAAANRPIAPPPPSANHVTATSMLDLSWPDSPIVGWFAGGVPRGQPSPGERFRDRTALGGIMHHLIVFPGPRAVAGGISGFAARWSRQVEMLDARALPDGAAERAGLSEGGALLVRPDGFIGFRADLWNAAAVAALDAHLARQLVPA